MNNSDKNMLASTREEKKDNISPQRATTGQQVVLTLKLIGVVGLLGGLLWVLDNVRVQ